jgi:SAM-dependent methyltransferase
MQDDEQGSAAGAASTATATDDAPTERDAVYGAYYYDRLIGDEESGRYEYTGEWREFFRGLAHHIVTRFEPKRTLDAGCAKGFLVRALREAGVEAFGVDASEYAIGEADDSIKEFVRVGSVTEALDGPYDLVTCIEVLEHLPADVIEDAIDRLCESTDRILFSSTPHDFVEPSHLNVKLPEDWVARFAARGFYRSFVVDTTFLTPWAVLLERAPAGDATVAVREYDRVWQRQRLEIEEMRAALIKLSSDLDAAYVEVAPDVRDMAEANADLADQLRQVQALHDDLQARHHELAVERDQAAARYADAVADREHLVLEHAEDHSELLRLRDQLIGREQELGNALGRVAEMESEMHRLGPLPQQYHAVVHSATWRISWKLFAPYRALRTRLAASGLRRPGGS